MEKEKLKNLISLKLSQRQIAVQEACSQSTVKYWLKKYNLKTKYRFKKEYECTCGESNPAKFYGSKNRRCGRCHNQDVLRLGKEKMLWAKKLLGGKCAHCNYIVPTGVH